MPTTRVLDATAAGRWAAPPAYARLTMAVFDWCADALGSAPVGQLVSAPGATVVAIRLHDGRIVKARPESLTRVRSCPDVELVARGVRDRLLSAALPPVLGHADWESHNLRWNGAKAHVVHDWDSVAWMPEAALAGLAAGGFASVGQPVLAPLESSVAFLDAYELRRGRALSSEERAVAWAASLWLATHNARMEAQYAKPALATNCLIRQAATRLRLAAA